MLQREWRSNVIQCPLVFIYKLINGLICRQRDFFFYWDIFFLVKLSSFVFFFFFWMYCRRYLSYLTPLKTFCQTFFSPSSWIQRTTKQTDCQLWATGVWQQVNMVVFICLYIYIYIRICIYVCVCRYTLKVICMCMCDCLHPTHRCTDIFEMVYQ